MQRIRTRYSLLISQFNYGITMEITIEKEKEERQFWLDVRMSVMHSCINFSYWIV